MYAWIRKRRNDQQSLHTDNGRDNEIEVVVSTLIEEGREGYSIYDHDDAPALLSKISEGGDLSEPRNNDAAPSKKMVHEEKVATQPENAVQGAIRKKKLQLMKQQVSQQLDRISPADMNDVDALLELYEGGETELMETLSSMTKRSESSKVFEKSSLYISSEEETSSAYSSEVVSISSGPASLNLTEPAQRNPSCKSMTSEGREICLAIDQAMSQDEWKDVEEKAAHLDRISTPGL